MDIYSYFDTITSKLTLDDMNVLGILYDNDATAKFKSMTNKNVIEQTQLTHAKYRKAINRLDALHFIETVIGGKEHGLYVSEFGIAAINKNLEGVDI